MEMLAAGVVDLGLTVAQVSELTPRHLHHFHSHYVRNQERESQRFAMLAAVQANVAGAKKADGSAFGVEDFLGKASTNGHHETDAVTQRSIAQFDSYSEKAGESNKPVPWKVWRFDA